MSTTPRRHRLIVEHLSERPSPRFPGVIDFHESTSVDNERDVLVLYVYQTTGAGYAYHVLVGKGSRASYPVASFASHDAALRDGLAALRRIPGYDAENAPVVRTIER